jgi:hypothetical protein
MKDEIDNADKNLKDAIKKWMGPKFLDVSGKLIFDYF